MMNKKRPISVIVSLMIMMSMVVSSFSITTLVFAAPAKVGDASFQKNLELFPGLWSETEGVTQPVFQWTSSVNSGTNNIMEEVYVEVPLDTDDDGQRDLIRVTIRRQYETDLYADLKVPVIMQFSPYAGGGGMTSQYPDHFVAVDTLKVNASTENYTYEDDVVSGNPRASAYVKNWNWSQEAYPALNIPAGRTPASVTANGKGTAVSSMYGSPGNAIVQPFFVRGYAFVSASSMGNASSEGFTSCGDVDETVAAVAVIQWLNGKAKAYTNQTDNIEVDATYWCNGNVAMTGTSYNGTMPTAAASSGVDGLKAIVPCAAISSWYDYYRENSLARAPYTNGSWAWPATGTAAYDTFQGEDADSLAAYCFSRGQQRNTTPSNLAWSNDVNSIKQKYDDKIKQMRVGENRDSGDYNSFWDDRNYLPDAGNIKAGVLVHQGFADFNVKPKHVDQLYRAMKAKKAPGPIKLILHRSGHTNVYTHDAVFDNTHKWFDHFLYGIDNGIVKQMPEVSIINSITGQYEYYKSWPLSGDRYQKYYLNPENGKEGSAAGALSLTIPKEKELKVKDTGASWVNSQKLSVTQLQAWETRMMGVNNLDAAHTERLAFVTDITENVRFSGTIKATLEVASDQPFGYITAALVEIDDTANATNRTFGTTTVKTISGNGISNVSVVKPSGVTFNKANGGYRIVTLGHADIQNPNPTGKTYMDSAATNFIPEYYYKTVETTPGKSYPYTFEFVPYDYEFRAGTKMAIMVYSTDYRSTQYPLNNIPELTIYTGAKSFIEIPVVGTNTFNTNDATAVVLTTPTGMVQNGDTVNIGTAFNKEMESNAAILNYTFDADKFSFKDFTPANGVKVLDKVYGDGYAKITVMVDDYKTKDYGTLSLLAKDDLPNGDYDVNLTVYMALRTDGVKTNEAFSTTGQIIGTIPPGSYDLVDLSNIIDAFGIHSGNPEWRTKYRFMDFNGNGEIDIDDIVHVAQLIII